MAELTLDLDRLRQMREVLPPDRRNIGFGPGGIDARIAELEAQQNQSGSAVSEAEAQSAVVEPDELDTYLEQVIAEREEEQLRPRRELEAAATREGRSAEAPVLVKQPVSRQEIYAGLLEKEAALEARIKEAKGVRPAGEVTEGKTAKGVETTFVDPGVMFQLFGADVLPKPQPSKAEELERELADIRTEKERTYAIMVDGVDEYEKLKDLRVRLSEATDEPTRANLQKQIKITQDILQKKGVRTGITAEGEEVTVQTALPTSRPGVLEPALDKAIANVKRSVESLYMPSEEAEPLIMDEDTATNLIAEITPIVAASGATPVVVGKVLIALGKTSNKWQYLSSLLAPAAGEATFTTTEETATFAEDLFGREWVKSDIETKKMAIIAESLAVDVAMEGVVKSVDLVTRMPVLGGFIKALPTLLFGGEVSGRQEAGQRVLTLLSRAAKGDVTPERELELLQELRATMGANFKAQTGVDFDDYLKALEEDANAIAKGASPDVIQRTGKAAQLIPEDKFLPLTADLVDSAVLKRASAGFEGGAAQPEFLGSRDRQRAAIDEEKQRIGETALPPTDEPRALEQIAGEAEQAGASSRLKIKTRVENEVGKLNAVEEKAIDDLEQAVDTLRTEVEVSPAVSGVNVPTTQEMDRAADDASDVFFSLFKGADNQRKEIYETYTSQANQMEIPAEDYQNFLETIGGEEEVGNVIQILIKRDPMYGEVLGQLQQQARKLDRAIDEKVYEATQNIPKPKDPRVKNPKAWEAYDLEVATAEKNVRDTLQSDPEAMQALKDEVGYQEIKLSNIEGLLQGINAELRGAQGADSKALGEMSSKLEQFITQRIPAGSDLAKARTEANQYFQAFQGLYKYIPAESKAPLRYGDDITATMEQLADVELGSMQTGFARMLDQASSDPRVAGQSIQNIRSQLQGEELAKFDQSVNDYFTNKLYGEEISVYVDDLSGETDPKKIAAKAQQVAQKVKEALRNPKYRYLEQLAPGVRDRILKSAEELRVRGVDLRTKDKAVDKLKKDLGVERKAISERPAAVYAEGVVGGRFGVDSIQATADMILSKDAGQIFEQSWEILGTVGKKGEDGLTLGQRDLKKVMAQSISSLLLTSKDAVNKAAKEAVGTSVKPDGEVSIAMLNRILESPAFDKAFPLGDPTRVAVNSLAAKSLAVQSSQRAAKLTGESVSDILEQSRNLVDGLIRYAKGPLSKEGRQASMVARAFFKLVGGQDKVNEILMEVFTNPAVAAKLLKEQEDVLRRGLEDDPLRAYWTGLNNYLLQRIGITTMDEFNEKTQALVIEEQMREIGAVPAQ